eukprot:GHVQ01013787.1.p2 GENE.GHVQ01013787.1~~GHVQ01013787.1.p2  ORF type:complete len:277 (+),score=31.77 GHVQ01013787.1:2724-3554(+)
MLLSGLPLSCRYYSLLSRQYVLQRCSCLQRVSSNNIIASVLYSFKRKFSSLTSPEAQEDISDPKRKGSQRPEPSYLPYIPASFAKQTFSFVTKADSLEALYQLIFSKTTVGKRCTEPLRLLYQQEREDLQRALEEEDRSYGHRQRAGLEKAFDAIRNLPADLYEEAVTGSNEVPEDLQFHHMYRQQLIRSELSCEEIRALQVFQNLMHYRFPHALAKRTNPELFWFPDNRVHGRRRIADGAKAAELSLGQGGVYGKRDKKKSSSTKKKGIMKSSVH